jgi:dTDP-4-dehydrorhamnose 3,5-epimerase/CDP-3, 6-dideoxy-D-glycero-D-glycero-4-hexulose-5-epimerase
MHFQNPPHDHVKLVYVIAGSIIDVLIDLRSTSATFGQYLAVELSDKNRRGIYIDRGFAHGFLALENNTIVEYHTSTSQNKESEGGVLYNSFGFDWPVVNAIVSNRDLKHTPVSQFKTPF